MSDGLYQLSFLIYTAANFFLQLHKSHNRKKIRTHHLSSDFSPGAYGIRTRDLHIANVARSQLC